MKVFVSYYHTDAEKLRKVKSFLQEHRIRKHRIKLFADVDITPGEDYLERIKEEIRTCDVFLLIYNNEKTKGSSFCNQEIGYAKALRKLIIPAIKSSDIKVKDHRPWNLIRNVQAIKYNNTDDLCTTLLDCLQSDDVSSPVSLDKQPVSDLTIMNLLGSCEESSEGDRTIAQKLANKNFQDWIEKLRDSLRYDGSPVVYKNGVWKIKDRLATWAPLGKSVFNGHLDSLRECAVQVFSEPDPQFELPAEQRLMANVYHKVPKYSPKIKKGLAETLALLGDRSEDLEHCSEGKVEWTVTSAIRETFENADWVLWASLDSVLPLLAEASPDEFIHVVDKALRQTPCPFDGLFSQETSGVFGTIYTTGLLRALETLAWHKEYLSRVTSSLGYLASRDPGGSYVNRPANSLSTIFLPWFPQTMASWEKQKSAIKILKNENHEIAWKTLLALLPCRHGTSSDHRKPWSWSYSIDDRPQVTRKEYADRVSFYSDMAVEMAMENEDKLVELIKHFDRLPTDPFKKLMAHLEFHGGYVKKKRDVLWNGLTDLVSEHRRYSDAEWALPKDLVDQIEKIANKIAPSDLKKQHRRLFNKEDYDLCERDDNYEEQRKEIRARRQNAIKEIVDEGGVASAIQFAQNVKHPYHAGYAFGSFVEREKDSSILKNYLAAEPKYIAQFIAGFIQAKYQRHGWEWVDEIDISQWTEAEKSLFLRYLPFGMETWKRAKKWMKNDQEYWRNADVWSPRLEVHELLSSVDKLLECNRPVSALHSLYWMVYKKLPLPQKQSIKALSDAVSTQENRILDSNNIAEIIKCLQGDPNTNPDELCQVEWAYLSVLNELSDASPAALNKKLASDAKFFHEIISLAYRPEGEKHKKTELTEKQRSMARNAFSLVEEWNVPPGTQLDGMFSEDKFGSWLKTALKMCEESGRLEAAKINIGKVLVNSPEDPDGLWIHRTIAKFLNGRDAENIRHGFCIGFLNARGAYTVDPAGKPEKALAEKYRGMAEGVETEGFQNLSAALRELAKEYERDARKHIEMAGEKDE